MPEQKNGRGKKMTESERLAQELEKANTRITQNTEWMRGLSNDLRRLGEKLYGLTEGRVTLSDVKLPDGRYRTPDQSPRPGDGRRPAGSARQERGAPAAEAQGELSSTRLMTSRRARRTSAPFSFAGRFGF